MKVHISEHFTYKKIFHLVIFPIIMMVFTSLYSIVDGIFISNFTNNPSSFAAVNLIFPFIIVIGSIGFMMGAGGTALVSKKLGEGKSEEANRTFSLIIYFTIGLGIVMSIAGYFLVEPVVKMMAALSKGSTDNMVSEAIIYGRILTSFQMLFMMQNVFQSFFMVAEKPRLGFRFTIAAGLTNMALDALFIGVFRWGVMGAAFATATGYLIASVGPLLYFAFSKTTLIKLGKCNFNIKDIIQSMYNGMSEFLSNIAMSIVSILYNAQLLITYGEDGVSAYGIIMYLSFTFCAMFIGYSIGIAPVVGYNYGAKNHDELKNVLQKSLIIIGTTSIVMYIISMTTAYPFSYIFAKNSPDLLELTITAIRIYSITYLFAGFSIYFSSFFTALNNGTISLLISLLRTLLFQVGFLYLFPLFFPDNGIWWAVGIGEVMGALVAATFVLLNKKKYGY